MNRCSQERRRGSFTSGGMVLEKAEQVHVAARGWLCHGAKARDWRVGRLGAAASSLALVALAAGCGTAGSPSGSAAYQMSSVSAAAAPQPPVNVKPVRSRPTAGDAATGTGGTASAGVLVAPSATEGELARKQLGIGAGTGVASGGNGQVPVPGEEYEVVGACAGAAGSRVLVVIRAAGTASGAGVNAADAGLTMAGATVVCDGQTSRTLVGTFARPVVLEVVERGVVRQGYAVLVPARS